MANEAVIVELLGNQGEVVDFTVADAHAFAKGTLMRLTDPRTISGAHLDGEFFAGIAAADKVASDGAVNLGVYTKLIADLRTDGGIGITAGERVKISGTNTITIADDDTIANAQEVVGVALETAAAGVAETIEVAIGVY